MHPASQPSLLSMVGRLSLIKVVPAPITYYHMPATILSSSICEKVDKAHISYLWSDTETQKHTH